MFSVRPGIGLYCVLCWFGFWLNSASHAHAQSLSQNWLVQSDVPSDCEVTAIAVDTINHFVYVALVSEGITESTLEQLGTITSETEIHLNSFGNEDVCIMKRHESGEVVWALSLGGNGYDRIEDMILAPDGSLYLVGYYLGTFKAETISGEEMITLPDNGGINESHAVIVSYDASGNLRWYSNEGGNGDDKYFAVSATTLGIVAIGTFFENNSEDLLGTNVTSPNNDEDVFIGAYTYDGEPDWLIAGGSTEKDFDHSIDPYLSHYDISSYRDTLYFGAYTGGLTFDFDYSTNFALENSAFEVTISSTDENYVIGALTKDGKILWLQRQLQSGDKTGALAITADCDGVYLAATASDELIWEGSSPVDAATNGNHDIFIAKYDKINGDPIWFELVSNSTNDNDFVGDIVCDQRGNLMAVGSISSNATVQGNGINADGAGSAFILSLNTQGVYQSHFTIDVSGELDYCTKVALTQNRDIFVCGTSSGDLDADQLISNNTLDGFAALLNNDAIQSSFCCSGIPFSCSNDTLVSFVDSSCQIQIPDLVSYYGTNNCPEYSYSQSPSLGTMLNVGEYSITITNALGDWVCSRTIQVTDTITPVIIGCPGDQLVELSDECEFVLPNYVSLFNIDVIDTCSVVVLTQTPPEGTIISSNTQITISLSAGVECSFWVNVLDNINPSIVGCPAIIDVDYSDQCEFVVPDFVSLYGIYINDNCPVSLSLVQVPSPGEIISTNTMCTISILEFPGISCSFEININDVSPPEINCSPDILTCDQTVFYTLDFADNCVFAGYEIFPAQYNSGAVFPIGTTEVTVNAWDVAGNTSTCSFYVTVDPSDCCTPEYLSLISATNSNPCEGEEVLISLTQYFDWIQWYVSIDGGTNFDLYPSSELSFLWTAHQDWIIKAIVSVNSCIPVWTAPLSIDVIEMPGFIPDMTLSVVNCQATMPDIAGPLNANSCWNFVQSILPGTILSTGIYGITISELNYGTLYIVNVSVPDLEAPVILANTEVSFVANSDCGYELNFDELNISISDCQLSDTTVYVNGFTWNIQDSFLVEDGDEISIDVLDFSGNSSTLLIDIGVIDETCPAFEGAYTEYMDVELNSLCGYVVEEFALVYSVSDNCSGLINPDLITQNPIPGTVLYDDSAIILEATDQAGNSCQKVIEIVFVDNTAPVLVCPQSVSSTINNSCIGVLEDVIPLVVVDDCSPYTVIQTPAAGETYTDFGPVLISILVQDEFGNIATCDIIHSWENSEEPLIILPLDQTIYLGNNCFAYAPDYSVIEVENVCDYEILQIPAAGTELAIGPNEINLNIDLETGESLSYTVVLNVVDTISPVVICPQDIVVSADEGLCGAIVEYSLEVTDNCSIEQIDLISGYVSGSLFPIDIHTITYEIFDVNGNASSCSFSIEVEDVNPPTFIVQDVTSCSQEVWYDFPIVNDECGFQIIAHEENIVSGGIFPIGETTLSYTITDESGNSVEANQIINVLEIPDAGWMPLPSVICQNDDLIDLTDLVTSIWPYEFNTPFEETNTLDPSLLEAGSYQIVMTTSNGACVQDSIQTVEILALPQLLLPDEFNFCGLEAELSIETTGSQVDWFLPPFVISQGSSNQQNIDLLFPEYGAFEINVQSSLDGMCPVNGLVDVVLWEEPLSVHAGEDQIIYFIDHANLMGEAVGMGEFMWSSTNDQIEFSNPENSITEVFGLSPGLTSLYLTISNGLCSPITDEIIIEVKGFNIPTVFSPNGDGLNETFEIKGLENLPEVKIRIYDDWGMELYSSQSYKNEWNGTFPSGRWIADGTYYYALEIEEELILGFIEIKR